MKKTLYILLALMLFQYLSFSQSSVKCDVEHLKIFQENINEPDYEITKTFILTFDSSCSLNIEYSEWSNVLLFQLIDKNINLLSNILHELGWKSILTISNEIRNPLLDFDLQKVYDKIKLMQGSKDIKNEFENAILDAAKKDSIVLK